MQSAEADAGEVAVVLPMLPTLPIQGRGVWMEAVKERDDGRGSGTRGKGRDLHKCTDSLPCASRLVFRCAAFLECSTSVPKSSCEQNTTSISASLGFVSAESVGRDLDHKRRL